MNKKIIWTICVVLFVAFFVGWAINRFVEPRTISVVGECLTSVPKDRTAITLRISVTDKSAAKSMRIASSKAAEINEFLKTLDVKVQTSEFNSYEKNQWNHTTQKSDFVGIETTIALDVSASNIDVIETILNKFAGTQDVFISNLRMFTSDETMTPALESCLGYAVKNARNRADALAFGVGRRVGKMLAVSYGTSDGYVAPTANFRMAKLASVADSGYAGGAITSKDTDVSVHVSAIFEIK